MSLHQTPVSCSKDRLNSCDDIFNIFSNQRALFSFCFCLLYIHEWKTNLSYLPKCFGMDYPNSSGKDKKKSGKKSKGVKLSTDPQSVAARERRHRISDRFKILQSLVPGGTKMDTVSMLEEAIHYVKYLKTQIWLHQTMINFADDDPSSLLFHSDFLPSQHNHHHQQQQSFCSPDENLAMGQPYISNITTRAPVQDSYCFQGEEAMFSDASVNYYQSLFQSIYVQVCVCN